jgi:fatty acid desaturase
MKLPPLKRGASSCYRPCWGAANKMKKQKIKSYLADFCRILLPVMAMGLIVVSLMSGSENSGILKNTPNALPWILLLVFALIAFRWQILGGILVVLFGIFTIFFFGAVEFLWILFVISLPLIAIGLILTLSGFSKR